MVPQRRYFELIGFILPNDAWGPHKGSLEDVLKMAITKFGEVPCCHALDQRNRVSLAGCTWVGLLPSLPLPIDWDTFLLFILSWTNFRFKRNFMHIWHSYFPSHLSRGQKEIIKCNSWCVVFVKDFWGWAWTGTLKEKRTTIKGSNEIKHVMTVWSGSYISPQTDKCKEPIPKTLHTLLFMRWSGDLYLLLELSQLSRQVGHQPHGWLQLFLQVPYFILLPLAVTAHQGHGTHPREPVQVVLLIDHQANQQFTFFVIQKGLMHTSFWSWGHIRNRYFEQDTIPALWSRLEFQAWHPWWNVF